MSVPTYPMVNLGELYLNGLGISFIDTTHVGVNLGQARDHLNINDIVLPQNALLAVGLGASINTRFVGLNGLDTGVLAPNTFYYVYVIGDSTGFQPSGALLSLSATQPTVPGGYPVGGYDMYRRIGTVRTDATAAPGSLILAFLQDTAGTQTSRHFWYDVAIVVKVAGAAAAYTALGAGALSLAVPPISTDVYFQADLLPNAPGDLVRLRYTGAAGALGQAEMSGDVAAVHHFGNMVCPCNATPSIDWITDAASTVQLSVVGYIDRV
jgi:hypothetical protein